MQLSTGGAERAARALSLLTLASAPRPLPRVLGKLCSEIASLLPADVVSVYLREADAHGPLLVMRANIGLGEGAVGNIQLRPGEGITGFAAEILAPVWVQSAGANARNKPFPGIGEESFPSFLALPVVRGGEAVAVLVLQRGPRDGFQESERLLSAALTGAIGLALEVAAGRAGVAETRAPRPVRLHGVSVVDGQATGTARLLEDCRLAASNPRVRLSEAFDRTARMARRSLEALGESLPEVARSHAYTISQLLSDQRLRATIEEACEELGVGPGLVEVARRYALTPYRTGADGPGADWLVQRARAVSSLCTVLAHRVGDRPPVGKGEALVCTEDPGAFVALELVARQGKALVIGDAVNADAATVCLLQAAGVPVVAEVAGAYEWMRGGEPLLVDGNMGTVSVRPSAAARVDARERGRGDRDAED